MARQILRFLGTRYGMVVMLGVLIVAVVGVARAVNGPVEPESVGPPPPVVPSTTTSPEDGDDSLATSEGPVSPTSIPGSPGPDAVALDFARAWLRSRGVSGADWRKGMEPFATPRLMTEFAETDPTAVPADSIRGPAQVRARDEQLADVTVPVEPGTLRLRLVVSGGRWLVDGVDWERS